MIKVLSCRFQKCLGPFRLLTVERCSETGLCRHFSNHVFRCLFFRKYISYEGHQCSKFDVDFTNGIRNSEKMFCFLDNSSWIGCCKFSPLRKENLSLAVIVLTNNPRFQISLRETFCNSISSRVVEKFDKSVVLQISPVIETV